MSRTALQHGTSRLDLQTPRHTRAEWCTYMYEYAHYYESGHTYGLPSAEGESGREGCGMQPAWTETRGRKEHSQGHTRGALPNGTHVNTTPHAHVCTRFPPLSGPLATHAQTGSQENTLKLHTHRHDCQHSQCACLCSLPTRTRNVYSGTLLLRLLLITAPSLLLVTTPSLLLVTTLSLLLVTTLSSLPVTTRAYRTSTRKERILGRACSGECIPRAHRQAPCRTLLAPSCAKCRPDASRPSAAAG